MSLLLYNLAIQGYLATIKLASAFNLKAKLFIKGRTNLFTNIQNALKDNHSPIAWFHCASLGEFEQCRPVLEQFKKHYPHYKIFLTFFSPSGYEVRKNYAMADYIFYLPMDTAANAKRFYDIVQPSLVFFVKYEFWYHFIKEASSRQVPIILFSAIFRASQPFFKPYGAFFRMILQNFDFIFVQNSHSYNLLYKINAHNTALAGDTRFDRVYEIYKTRKEIPAAQKFKGNQKVMVVGSSWPEDMEVLYPVIDQFRDIKFIVAPHEITEPSVSEIEKRCFGRTVRYSQATEQMDEYQVLIIDNIGMLSSLYQYGEYAYVGGAFGKGLHNILEAATYGVPVFFGHKNYKKFQEANDLIKEKGAFAVSSVKELSDILKGFEENESLREKASEASHNYVKANLGASDKIMEYVHGILKNKR